MRRSTIADSIDYRSWHVVKCRPRPVIVCIACAPVFFNGKILKEAILQQSLYLRGMELRTGTPPILLLIIVAHVDTTEDNWKLHNPASQTDRGLPASRDAELREGIVSPTTHHSRFLCVSMTMTLNLNREQQRSSSLLIQSLLQIIAFRASQV